MPATFIRDHVRASARADRPSDGSGITQVEGDPRKLMPMTWPARTLALAMLFAAQLNGSTRAEEPLETIHVDGGGVGRTIVDWPREQACEFGVWVVRDDWRTIAQQWSLVDRQYARAEDARVIRAAFDAGGKRVTIEQQTRPTSVRYALSTPAAIEDLTGLFWFFGLPTDAFAGGGVTIGERTIALPADGPADVFLGEATGEAAVFTSRDKTRRVELRFGGPRTIRVQDARPYGTALVQLYTPLHAGPIAAGHRVTFDVSLKTTVTPSRRDASVTVDTRKTLSRLDGLGGNFVYSIDDPATDVVLRQMTPTWARIAIEGREWTSAADEARAIAAADVAGSPLRKRFELAKRLNAITKGRLILSMWYPPERLFVEPVAHREQAGVLPRERWPALADGIVAYLLRLKTVYGVEPRYFSFNESDLGVYVKLDAAETRDLTKLLGTRFGDAGLKTTLLLGDSADLAKGLAQIGPTLADASARQYVGALAYHPWAGQNEQWPKWAALAERYALPLMATEMGSDADAWRNNSYNTPLQTLRLARRYVEQFRDARTQALLEWEWTGDYAMTEKAADGTLRLSPRGEVLKQLANQTPTFARSVQTTSDDPAIDAATIVDDAGRMAVHLVNSDADRVVRVTGLPDGAMTLRIVDARTGAIEPSRVDVTNNACTIAIPAGALATLTTE